MGCCKSKESPIEYMERQTEKLLNKLAAYTGGTLDRYNLVRAVAYGMKELVKKKLQGEQKKTLLTSVILELLQSGSYPQEIAEKMVHNVIEDVYVSFRNQFKKGCC